MATGDTFWELLSSRVALSGDEWMLTDDHSQRVRAVVEITPGATPITFQQMSDHCRQAGLMTRKIPEQLELIDTLLRNPTLKILKRVLVDRYATHDVVDETGEVPA